MAAKSENIFVRAKAYQKLHPRTAWAECIQKVKGKKVSGTRKVAGTKKVGAAPKKRTRITGTKSILSKVTGPKKTISGIARANKLIRDIARLELKRKSMKAKELKDIVQMEINACHDKLDAIKRSYRRKSA